MLFPFAATDYPLFWMKEMLIPLDFVWIDHDCRIEEVTEEAPTPVPGTSDTALPTYKPKQPVQYILEINAGEAKARGVVAGAPVAFRGEGLRAYGCFAP